MMKQEDKYLLLKDLCARLSHGVKVKIPSIESPLTILSINTNGVTWVTRDTGYPFEIDWENCKPYLFPLSTMTEEQWREFFETAVYEVREEDCGRHTEMYYYDMVGHNNTLYPNCDSIDWLNAHHYDYRYLIEKGLAIDATDKNIY